MRDFNRDENDMSDPVRTVALVDWNWSGHHPANFTLYASALAQLGVRVLAFCAQPGELPGLLSASPIGQSEAALARIEPPESIEFPYTLRLPLGKLAPLLQATQVFGGLGNRLRAWERATGVKIDLVFFACIYDANFEQLRFAERFFRFPWSGLYLHARSFRMPGSPIPNSGRMPCPEKIFTLSSLRSAAVLDEKAVTPLRELSGGKPVVAFPDPTDLRLPAKSDPAWGLAKKILEFARGRPVVSLVGHLQRSKGLEEFTRAAQDESLRGMVFSLAGEVSWREFNDASRQAILAAWEQLPNVFTHLQRITDERALNAAMASSNIIYAAYTDFPNSSGILTKAAVFERPVIVSDGYLMAERTRAYRLGEVVKERDMAAIRAALRRLGGLDAAAERIQGGRWKEYREAHSYERLVGAFAELLGIPSDAAQGSGKPELARRSQVEV
jgi:hypothetical protein